MNTSTDTLLKSLARKIRQRRVALGMTQQQLAQKTGLSRSFIAEVENDFALSSLQRLACALEISVQEMAAIIGPAAALACDLSGGPCLEPEDKPAGTNFSADQIVALLQACEAGANPQELCLNYGISEDILNCWRLEYGGKRLSEVRRLRTARKAQEEADRRRVTGSSGSRQPQTAASAMLSMGDRALREQNLALAEQLYRLALTEAQEAFGKTDSETLSVQIRMGGALVAQGRLQEAEQLYRNVLADLEDLSGTKEAMFVMVLLSLAELLEARGDAEEAADLRMKARPILEWYSSERFPVLDTHDTTELLEMLLGVVGVISASQSREQLIQDCLEVICLAKDWQVGEAWFPDGDGALVCKQFVANSHLNLDKFKEHTFASRFIAGVGLPGRVLLTKTAYWSEDLALDFQIIRAKSALEAGLTAAAAFPVYAGCELLCIFVFFFREDRPVDQTPLYILDELGACIGAVLARLGTA